MDISGRSGVVGYLTVRSILPKLEHIFYCESRSWYSAVCMPIACLYIPSFSLRIALLDQPEMDGHLMVRGNPEGGRPVVIDVNAEAME